MDFGRPKQTPIAFERNLGGEQRKGAGGSLNLAFDPSSKEKVKANFQGEFSRASSEYNENSFDDSE